jgi:hypothetical protein
MEKQMQADDLRHIRDLMERSSKFLSLSGLSGICAGISALLGAAYAYFFVFDGYVKYDEHLKVFSRQVASTTDIRFALALVGLATLLVAGVSAWYFSAQKARRAGVKMWNSIAKRTLYHLLLPLAVGGVFGLALTVHNDIHLLASVTLLFYGLALINAGKFTFSEVHYLGLSEIVLGLLAAFILSYGLFFWIVGFGILHIVYGTYMYFKYDSEKGKA